MRVLRRQLVRRDFVQIVTAIGDRVGPKESPATPQVYRAEADTIADRDVVWREHALGEQPGAARFAEAVLPGHPDKLADQIADAIVDIALAHDDRAIVQVEVAVHNAMCHVNGRVSTAGGALDPGRRAR